MRNPKWARYWPDKVVVRIATIGHLGSWKAPGTWGSAMGLIFYATVIYPMSEFAAALFLIACSYFALGVCGEAEKRLKKVDPGEVILDEFVAMPICLLGLKSYMGQEYSALVLLTAFALFRFLDILKPLGIRRLQRYHGGFGVMADDVAAALIVCVALNLGVRLVVG